MGLLRAEKDSAQRSTLGRRSKGTTGGFSTISTYSLFLAVLLGVSLHCLFGVPSGVNNMGPRCVSMVCRLLMTSGLVMFGRFPVVASGMRQMF